MENKVTCFTLYNSLNYGAFFQAFALQEILKNKYNINLEFYKIYSKVNYKNKTIKNKIYKYILHKKFISCHKRFKLNKNICKKVILGSDEIWNLKNNTFPHLPEFFGIGIKDKIIMSYAPSCNGTKKEDIISNYGNDVLSNIDYLSVRDYFSKSEIKKILPFKKIQLVLDPTLLLNDYDKYIKRKKSFGKYILLYGYKFSKKEIEEIDKFSMEKELKVYAIGIYNKNFKNIIASPFEFLYYIKEAEYVITKTFHGSIFSIIFNKKFIVYDEDNIKITNLFEFLNIKSQLIKVGDLIKIERNIDYNNINFILDEERKKSLDFLSKINGGEYDE